MEDDKKIEVAKVSVIDKIKWRLLYRDCYKKFGYDTAKINLILSNPKIAQYYKKNKQQINNLLNLYEKTLSTEGSRFFNIILQSIERDCSECVIKNIEELISQNNYLKSNEMHVEEGSVVDSAQKKLSRYIEDCLTDLNIEILENGEYKENLSKYNEKVDFAKKLQEKYGLQANEILEKYNKIIERLDKQIAWKESIQSKNNFDFPSKEKRMRNICDEALQNGTDIETINKYVTAIDSMGSGFDRNYGENVKDIILNNVEDIGFYIKSSMYISSESDIEENYTLNDCIQNKRITVETAVKIRNKFFDARIRDEFVIGNMEKIKSLVCKKYFGITKDNLPQNIANLPEESKSACNWIKKISMCKDFFEIKKIMQDINQSEFSEFSNIVVNQISNALKDEFKGDIFSVKDRKISSYCEYAGKKIPVIVLNGEDFKGVIHVSRNIRGFEDINKWKRSYVCISSR